MKRWQVILIFAALSIAFNVWFAIRERAVFNPNCNKVFQLKEIT